MEDRDVLLDGVMGRVRGTEPRVHFVTHGNIVEVSHTVLGFLAAYDKNGWRPRQYFDFEEEILSNLDGLQNLGE